jgi:hypothetical protein
MVMEGTRRVQETYDNDEFQIFVIEGAAGVGKTTYADKIIAELYGSWSIPMFKKHTGFHPRTVLEQWHRKRQRDRCFHWDDAGAWLHSLDYNDPFVKRVGKYLQTARTSWGVIEFTCIDADDLAKKIRAYGSAIKVKITKHSDKEHPYRRIATAKHMEKDWYGQIYWVDDWEEEFTCRMPDSFYRWYTPQRKKYAKMTLDLAIKAAEEDEDIMETYKEPVPDTRVGILQSGIP